MNGAHSSARPPRWAEGLLRMLLKPEDRESVSGDLLEEYREAMVPTHGSAADRWYVRQVASFLLRASWAPGAILGAAFVIRYLLDTLMPATDYLMRASMLTYTVLATCLMTGFNTAWRERSMRASVLISFTAATIGAMISIVGTAVMLAIWHDPVTLDAWRSTGGLQEALIDVPVELAAIGATVGLAGGLLGKGISLGRRSR